MLELQTKMGKGKAFQVFIKTYHKDYWCNADDVSSEGIIALAEKTGLNIKAFDKLLINEESLIKQFNGHADFAR